MISIGSLERTNEKYHKYILRLTAAKDTPLMDYLTAITLYLAFGFIHEFSHFTAAVLCGLVKYDFGESAHAISWSWWKDLFFNMAVYRRFHLEPLDSDSVIDSSVLIRHVGWVTSVVIAIAVHVKLHPSVNKTSSDTDTPVQRVTESTRPTGSIARPIRSASSSCENRSATSWTTSTSCILAAYITAFDAICTDL
eukprot:CAMPEP_0204621004 /NCGR_PEP_ID=MMETSP0717-20131115/6871_1 /ASSEMBLY_ACC=CAM_ASM_000666 /TAXON_ID=230516 /ORGANISM="Chaetoceros curvisetus" /LENGTH=194 /DNA_ID=CAMNT_0051635333 /DNA_START=83 /DNA_END=664 /DNA_ORIENTATION=-